jgi:SAM-dependent methyltransferase
MGLYTRLVLPTMVDRAMRRPHLERRRRALLAPVSGRVLEIGVGTGLNLACYPAEVRRVVAVEPNPGMSRRLVQRARTFGIELERHAIAGEHLPFDAGAFDFAVSTWTLCSVRDPARVVAEIHRVLRPGGRFLFLEHGRSPDPGVRRWQRRLSPLQRLLGGGCRLDLDVRELLEGSPFGRFDGAAEYMEKTPRVAGFVYEGVVSR